jgi:hypothetical protein
MGVLESQLNILRSLRIITKRYNENQSNSKSFSGIVPSRILRKTEDLNEIGEKKLTFLLIRHNFPLCKQYCPEM